MDEQSPCAMRNFMIVATPADFIIFRHIGNGASSAAWYL
jgi:hypothetical protein